MWGDAIQVPGPESEEFGFALDTRGIWTDANTFVLFWIASVNDAERYLWMQRFRRVGMQLSADSDAIELGEVPITQPNPGPGGTFYLTLAPNGEVVVSFFETRTIFG